MPPRSPPSRREILRAAAVFGALAPALTAAAARSANGFAAGAALDVRDCGASGNGRDLDTAAINRAIEAVAAKGGGIVRIPAGDYLCTTIHLRDRITLSLERGAVLRAAPIGRYDVVAPNRWAQYQDYGHSHWRDSMICGVGVTDVAIVGPGLICGDGLSRGEWSHAGARRGGADKIIALKECRNVRLGGFNMTGSAHIAILATGVANLRIDRLLLDVGRDGIDLDCCEDVVVEDSCFNTPHDDSVVLKSSDALGYRRPTRNVQIRRCLVTGGYKPGTLVDGSRVAIGTAAGMKARIKIGTESCWGFDRVTVEDCIVWNALGIPLLAVDGGNLTNVVLRDIALRNVQDAPLFLRLGSRLRAPASATVGRFAGITVENVTCTGFRMPLTISGIPGHRIADVSLRDIELAPLHPPEAAADGGWIPLAAAPSAPVGIDPPERPDAYPEAGMFGPLPAQFLFARHVENLAVDGLRLKAATPAPLLHATAHANDRPLFWLEDVHQARFADVDVPPGTAEPICHSDSACSVRVSLGADRSGYG